MTIKHFGGRSTAQFLRWELAWLSVEILGVVAGLWLSLRAAPVQLGGTVLFFVFVVSLLVRMQHYSSLKR